MEQVDVVVVGAGAAGVGAAQALGRAGRRVLVLNGGDPRNAAAQRTTGIPWLEPLPSFELQTRAHARLAELQGFVRMHEAAASSVQPARDGGLVVAFGETASHVHARAVIFATGVVDRPPNVPGLANHWGSRVFGCPYCHGFEARGRRIATLGNGLDIALLTLHLLRWTTPKQPPTLVTADLASIPEDAAHQLRASGVVLHEAAELSMRQVERELHVEIGGGARVACDVVFTRALPFPQSELARVIGCTLDSEGHVLVDEMNRTSLPWVYAAGDVSRKPHVVPTMQVIQAAADGVAAGLACDQDLFAAELGA